MMEPRIDQNDLRDWLIQRVAHELNIGPAEVDSSAQIMALGIDSLALIGIAGELAEFTGAEVRAELLWEHDSIEALAHALAMSMVRHPDRSAMSEPASPVIESADTPLHVLRSGTTSHPVVSIGNYGIPTILERKIASHIPIWWLPLDRFYRPPYVIRPVPEMAAAFAEALLTRCKTPEVTLIGYSFGGVVAFDTACKLTAAGCDVRLLLIEPARVDRHQPERWAEKFRRHWFALRTLSWKDRAHYASTMGRRLSDRLRVKLFRRQLVERTRRGGECQHSLAVRLYMTEIERIMRGYRPPDFAGQMVLSGRGQWLQNNLFKWQQHCATEIEIAPPIDADNHNRVVEAPVASVWIKIINHWFTDEILGHSRKPNREVACDDADVLADTHSLR